jgi:methionyl-tRNA synthetase
MRHSGEEVVFICGSDNHGTPVVVSAEEQGISPRDLCERYHRHFDETFKRMDVIFDHFGMTDDPANHERTQSIVRQLIRNGYVYPETVQQCFCPKCSRFLPDRYVEGKCPHCGVMARGDECDQGCGKHLEPGEIIEPTCRICGTRAEMKKQEHFFFKLSAFRDYLLNYLDGLSGTSNAKNYAIGWVNDELRDWCITRTLEWGVSFPGRDDLVVYVWVDAPIGYIAFTEEWGKTTGKDWKKYWCGENRVTHFIGGDIIYHHTIFWPALLRAAGYGVPKAVVASGMVKIDDHKFSKSRGYVVWTNDDYLDKGLPSDYLRYYLLSYTNHTKELNFSWKVFQERINNELVGTLGNFIYRTLYFAQREFGGIPETPIDPAVPGEIAQSLSVVRSSMESYEFKGAVDAIMTLASFGNNYIQSNAPWKQIKEDRQAAARTIRSCLQIVSALSILIDSFMPERAQKIWNMLGNPGKISEKPLDECMVPAEPRVLPEPSILFGKLDDTLIKDLDQLLEKRVEEANRKASKMKDISIDEFGNLDIRIGTVLSATTVPKSKKLLLLSVDLGGEIRQIVSGIAAFYEPGDLVGRQVTVLANLAPATIFGVKSNGMILAAGDNASLLVPLNPVLPGTRIR